MVESPSTRVKRPAPGAQWSPAPTGVTRLVRSPTADHAPPGPVGRPSQGADARSDTPGPPQPTLETPADKVSPARGAGPVGFVRFGRNPAPAEPAGADPAAARDPNSRACPGR